MTLVLFFAAAGMITVFSYLLHQMSFSRPSLRSPSSLQALFNARSGIYKAFYEIIDSTGQDTLRTISTLDSAFGTGMFDAQPDTSQFTSQKPQLDGTPVEYTLFSDTARETCEVHLEPTGGKCKLIATGVHHGASRTVEATLGCPLPALPDTVVLYHSSYAWSGNKPRGTVAHADGSLTFNASWYNSLVDKYLTDLTDADSLIADPPLTISSSHDIGKIKSPVNGPLLIDGAGITITWHDTGTYIVKGDLQITGEVALSGMRFIVDGEIKLLDEASLSEVDLFSNSRVFIGDKAVFQGNILALHSITVYGKARITQKSSLIAGSGKSSSTKTTGSRDTLAFSLFLAEEAQVDAVCIALETPGSIKTDYTTTIRGILWAQHIVCHRGKMAGLIVASRCVDCDDPVQMTTESLSSPVATDDNTKAKGALVALELFNAIPGELEPLDGISRYSMPFFMGRLSIVHWKER